MKKLILLIVLTVSALCHSFAQVEPTSWRDHLCYRVANSVAIADHKVYCATEQGLFYYDIDDYSLNRLTPIQGLSDLGIGYIAYSQSAEKLVVGYSDGNIDLIDKKGSVINMPDLYEKDLSIAKQLNHINIEGNLAYLSYNFGLTAINLNRSEFTDTYILGENGNYEKVLGSAVYKGKIYAFTQNGILQGDLSNPFLSDRKNWNQVTGIAHPDAKYTSGCVFDNKLLVNCELNDGSVCEVSAFDGEKWTVVIENEPNIKSINSNGNLLVVAKAARVDVLDTKYNVVSSMDDKTGVMGIATDAKTLWYASSYHGLCRLKSGSWTVYFPSGPITSHAYGVAYIGGSLMLAPGGMLATGEGTWFQPDICVYKNDNWTKVDSDKIPSSVSNIVGFAGNGNDNHYYASAWRCGLIEVDGDEVRFFNSDNTNNILGNNVAACAFDKDANLWIASSYTSNGLVVKTKDGSWFNFDYTKNFTQVQLNTLTHTSTDDFWLASSRGNGILVWNANATPADGADDKCLFFVPKNIEGEAFDTRINTIAEDKNGEIWVGSSQGVYVFRSPKKILNGDNFYAQRPQMVVDGYYQDLLGTENVTAIVVDGGNRKWIGTEKHGLFVVSDDGTTQLAQYTKQNSYLLSDNIMSLAWDSDLGWLYIVTDKGLQSVRISSTQRHSEYTNVFAFPNPVEPNYNGYVTIRGLIDESVVKVTDLSGTLVYETISNGGDAFWNLKNMAGDDVATGIYLIHCATADGQHSAVTKVNVVR